MALTWFMVDVEEEAGGGNAANRPETQRGRDWRKLDFIPYPRGLALVFFDAKILLYVNTLKYTFLQIMSYRLDKNRVFTNGLDTLNILFLLSL